MLHSRQWIKTLSLLMLALCLGLGVSACKKKDEDKAKRTAEEMYNEGMDDLESKRYQSAIELFEELERTYPFSKLATPAEVMAAYAYYRKEDYDDAVDAVDRFAKLHPGNKDIAYMYYLKALCHYERITDVRRDQGYSLQAKDALKEVIRRFPDTEYARDAKLKYDLVLDHLAGKELDIGRFYLKQNNYIAAINRFKKVVDEYQTTTHTPEALHRLVEAYTTLGVKSEAQKYAAVLGHNFPGSKWYQYSYAILNGKSKPAPVAGREEENPENWYEGISKHVPFIGKKERSGLERPATLPETKEAP